MARRRELLPCCKTYGFPVYCAACVPINRILPTPSADTDNNTNKDTDRLFLALGGGGGEGRSGVPNALILSVFDYASGSLSDHPDGHLRVFKWPSMEIILDENEAHTSVKDLDFSSDAKYLVVSLGNSGPCRLWDLTSSTVAASLPREDVLSEY